MDGRCTSSANRVTAVAILSVLSSINIANADIVIIKDDVDVTLTGIANTLVGSGLSVTGVEFTGENDQIGLFSDYGALFGPSFTEGIILSTGKVIDVVSEKNEVDNTTTVFNEYAVEDIDLGKDVYDPAKLSFTFVPTFNTLTLDFIFGSEEYNEYVQSKYNDKLELLVNGVNCAKTPDGQIFSINTVNDRANFPPVHGEHGESSNPELYINNDPGMDEEDGRFERSVANYATQMDGFTKLIRCQASVIPNQENTLIIGIVDKGDARLDSWAFFRAQSLFSTHENDDRPTIEQDSDNDGIADVLEAPGGIELDSDNDGIPNFLDLDSDNDGIPDSVEYQGSLANDTNQDGFLDNSNTVVSLQNPVDTDNDGIADYLDLDSDNDSLTDLFESLPIGKALIDLDADQNGILDNTVDLDGDGLFDVVDPVIAITGKPAGTPLFITDTDSDGLYNYRDVDTDGDGFNDDIENGDFDKDGINDRLQKMEGLKTAVSGVGSGGGEWLMLTPVLLILRKTARRHIAPKVFF